MATTKTSKKAKTAKICQPPTSTSTTATIDDNNNINTDNNDAVVTLSRRQKSSLWAQARHKKNKSGEWKRTSRKNEKIDEKIQSSTIQILTEAHRTPQAKKKVKSLQRKNEKEKKRN